MKKMRKSPEKIAQTPCKTRVHLLLYQGISHGGGLSPMWPYGLAERMRPPEEITNMKKENTKWQSYP